MNKFLFLKKGSITFSWNQDILPSKAIQLSSDREQVKHKKQWLTDTVAGNCIHQHAVRYKQNFLWYFSIFQEIMRPMGIPWPPKHVLEYFFKAAKRNFA